jgi:multiple sugar transport system substrate-binding protein
MLQDGKTVDFWHDPNYAKMLSDQQEAFSAFSTGQVKDARKALDYIAYKQQQTLYDAGQTKTAPSGTLPSLS